MSIYYIFLSFIFLIAFLDVLVITDNKKIKILNFALFLLICTFVGLRYQIGLDWLFYQDLFEGGTFTIAIEPGYYFLSYISSSILGYWCYQALITVFFVLCLTAFFRKLTVNYLFCIGLFFLYQFIFVTEALRQIISLAIVLIAFIKYLEGKTVLFYLLVITAVLFHVSAIITFAILPFVYRRNAQLLKILALLGVVLSLINIYPIEFFLKFITMLPAGGYIEKVMWYSQDDYAGSIITFSLVFKILIILMFDFRFKSITSNESHAIDSRSYKVIYASLYLMLFIDVYLGRFGTISTRLDVYFIPFFLVAITYLIKEFRQGISRVLSLAFVMTYFAINYFSIMDGYYFEHFYSPYQNYISEIFSPGAYNDRDWDVRFYFSNKDLLQ